MCEQRGDAVLVPAKVHVWICQDRDAGEPGKRFLEQREAFAVQVGDQIRNARDVRVRACQGLDEAVGHRIVSGRHHDGNDRGRLPRRPDRDSTTRNENIHAQPDQLGRQVCQSCDTPLSVPVLDGDGGAGKPAEFAEPPLEWLAL